VLLGIGSGVVIDEYGARWSDDQQKKPEKHPRKKMTPSWDIVVSWKKIEVTGMCNSSIRAMPLF
jgi:hypothetical protein